MNTNELERLKDQLKELEHERDRLHSAQLDVHSTWDKHVVILVVAAVGYILKFAPLGETDYPLIILMSICFLVASLFFTLSGYYSADKNQQTLINLNALLKDYFKDQIFDRSQLCDMDSISRRVDRAINSEYGNIKNLADTAISWTNAVNRLNTLKTVSFFAGILSTCIFFIVDSRMLG